MLSEAPRGAESPWYKLVVSWDKVAQLFQQVRQDSIVHSNRSGQDSIATGPGKTP